MRKMGVLAVVLGMLMTGCVVSPVGGAPVSREEYLRKWVESCGFTPEEIYMVDIEKFAGTVLGKNCDQIRAALPVYRAASGDNWASLRSNSILFGPVPPINRLRAAYFGVCLKGCEEGKSKYRSDPGVVSLEMLVDFDNQFVIYSEDYGIDIVTNPGDCTKIPLDSDKAETALRAVSEHAPLWPTADNGTSQGAQAGEPRPIPTTFGFVSWGLNVAVSDYSTYAWGGFYNPEGLKEVADAFIALIKS